MKRISVLLLGLLMIMPVMAEKRYVTDKLWLQLRSGPGNDFRILKALKSGSHVNVVEADDESGFSRVTTDKGLEGWVLTRFLEDEPIAFEKLILTQRELDKAKADLTELQEKHAQAKKQLSEIKRVHGDSRSTQEDQAKELDHIKKISANAIGLDAKNKELMEQTEALKINLDTLKAENDRLKGSKDVNYILFGGGLVLLGLFLGWLLPKLSGRRGDGWA